MRRKCMHGSTEDWGPLKCKECNYILIYMCIQYLERSRTKKKQNKNVTDTARSNAWQNRTVPTALTLPRQHGSHLLSLQ